MRAHSIERGGEGGRKERERERAACCPPTSIAFRASTCITLTPIYLCLESASQEKKKKGRNIDLNQPVVVGYLRERCRLLRSRN